MNHNEEAVREEAVKPEVVEPDDEESDVVREAISQPTKLIRIASMTRAMLDEAGLTDCRIVASNSLDEMTISSLLSQGAKIDIFGVGERLITARRSTRRAGPGSPRSTAGPWTSCATCCRRASSRSSTR